MEKYYNKLNKKTGQPTSSEPQTPQTREPQPTTDVLHRTINLTHMSFTTEEQELLNQGMQYCIQRSNETQWKTLILETEQTIRLLEPTIQDAYRIMTARKLSQIRNIHHNISKTHKRQLHVANNIHNKQDKNNAIHTQADKGKTVVIIYEQEYHEKVRTFLSENNF